MHNHPPPPDQAKPAAIPEQYPSPHAPPARGEKKPSRSGKGVLEVFLEAPFGRIPLAGIRYEVANAYLPGMTLQKGLTDENGSFRIRTDRPAPPTVLVRYRRPDGRILARHLLAVEAGAARVHRLDVAGWLALARNGAPRRQKGVDWEPQLAVYRSAARELEARAEKAGVSVRGAVDRCLLSAHVLGHLLSALDAHLGGAAGGTRELLRCLDRFGVDLKAKSSRAHGHDHGDAHEHGDAHALGEGHGRTAGHGHAPAHAHAPGHEHGPGHCAECGPGPATLDPGLPGGGRLGPGMADAFVRIVEVGREQPDLGRGLLGLLFRLNRNTSPVLDQPDRDGSWRKPEIPLELVDPMDPRNTDPLDMLGAGFLSGGHHADRGELVAIACEAVLAEHYERTVGAQAAHGGGSGESRILGITPARDVLTGDRTVTIEMLSGGVAPARVRVSFPTRDGRVEVEGAGSGEPRPEGGFLNRISVVPPVRTVEGVVQVDGHPSECILHVPVSGPVPDRGVMRCLGGEPVHPVIPQDGHCEAQEVNWRGSGPELHFRWGPGGETEGDVRSCFGGGGQWLLPDPGPEPAADHAGHAHGAGHVHSPMTGAMTMAEPLVFEPPAKPVCTLRQESVVRVLEADEDIDCELRAYNDPTGPIALSALNLPVEALGSPSHLVDGTYYHADWGGIPADEWHALGIVPEADDWTPLSLATPGTPTTGPVLTLLKASADNPAPGYGRRVLEVARVVAPARIESIHLEPSRVVRPGQTFTIRARVLMPTYAGMGARLVVRATVGGQSFGPARTFEVDRKDPREVTFTDTLWATGLEGTLTVAVEVIYRLTGAALPASLRDVDQQGQGATTIIEVGARRRASIWEVPAEERVLLRQFIHEYAIEGEKWRDHARFHEAPFLTDAGNVTSGSVWFWWHREYIAGLEEYIRTRGTRTLPSGATVDPAAAFLPLPAWDPYGGIPEEFLVNPPPMPDPNPNEDLRDPRPYLDPATAAPYQGEALDAIENLDELGYKVQFYYHLAPHFESKGNLQFAERSGREYVFWLYHAHIDEFAEAWESRHTAIRGNQRSTPRCIGQPIEAALKTLALNGFLPGTISNNGPAVGTPVVTGQNPDPYTSNSKGARVDLTTTPFLPDAKRVPWLLGLPEGEAVAAVRALGMVPHTGDKPALRPDDVGRVVGQWPPASWIVPAGSDVQMDVARAVEVEVDWPW